MGIIRKPTAQGIAYIDNRQRISAVIGDFNGPFHQLPTVNGLIHPALGNRDVGFPERHGKYTIGGIKYLAAGVLITGAHGNISTGKGTIRMQVIFDFNGIPGVGNCQAGNFSRSPIQLFRAAADYRVVCRIGPVPAAAVEAPAGRTRNII